MPKEIGETLSATASDAHAALQFVRSTPGMTSAIVGMREPDHVDENLALASVAPASEEAIDRLFRGLA